jgi:hypothetical protein
MKRERKSGIYRKQNTTLFKEKEIVSLLTTWVMLENVIISEADREKTGTNSLKYGI